MKISSIKNWHVFLFARAEVTKFKFLPLISSARKIFAEKSQDNFKVNKREFCSYECWLEDWFLSAQIGCKISLVFENSLSGPIKKRRVRKLMVQSSVSEVRPRKCMFYKPLTWFWNWKSVLVCERTARCGRRAQRVVAFDLIFLPPVPREAIRAFAGLAHAHQIMLIARKFTLHAEISVLFSTRHATSVCHGQQSVGVRHWRIAHALDLNWTSRPRWTETRANAPLNSIEARL